MIPPGTTGKRLAAFAARVVSAFGRNRGLLLAGGVGYNALLSVVPLLAVTATGLSFLVDEAIILLLGAQVIAELEASSQAGVPWHQEPEPRDGGGSGDQR